MPITTSFGPMIHIQQGQIRTRLPGGELIGNIVAATVLNTVINYLSKNRLLHQADLINKDKTQIV